MLSPFRTLNLVKSVKLHRGLAGSAVAIAAALAGSIAVWSTGLAAQPAGLSHLAAASHTAAVSHGAPISPAASIQPGTLSRSPLAGSQPPRLDAFLATSAKPRANSGGRAGRSLPLTPRRIARRLLHRFHWSRRQFRYLNPLWNRESGWNVRAFNAYSGAYGIPQAMPGAKMASAGRNWQGSARTQILWGLRYIKADYGSPRGAWEHEMATGWY